MHQLEELFDQRSTVGARLQKILEEKKCTKAELYKNTHVSRPTIDKILEGTITSKKNYETHMTKIIEYLHITPDMLLGNTVCGRNRVREMRSVIRMSTEKMAEITGISQKRLQQIEAGEPAEPAELRDIAWQLSTSTHVLNDQYFFEPQMGELELFLENSNLRGEVSGFWGHVGILLEGHKKYRWYPITANTKRMICRKANDELLVIPCMNNKVLLLCMQNVREISLSDFDCDTPADRDWDEMVDCGETPLVVYEALEDYYFEEEEQEKKISDRMKKNLEMYVEKSGKTEEELCDMLDTTTIYDNQGGERLAQITFEDDTISEAVEMVYGYEMDDLEESFFYYYDELDGTENFVNVKNTAMIELPLLKVEEAICRRNCSESEG